MDKSPDMTRLRLILASLQHHARAHVGTLLGAVVAAAVLTGSLVVGDSVKRTLQNQAEQRLGYVQAAVELHDRFFAMTWPYASTWVINPPWPPFSV